MLNKLLEIFLKIYSDQNADDIEYTKQKLFKSFHLSASYIDYYCNHNNPIPNLVEGCALIADWLLNDHTYFTKDSQYFEAAKTVMNFMDFNLLISTEHDYYVLENKYWFKNLLSVFLKKCRKYNQKQLAQIDDNLLFDTCLLYTSPSPRDRG